MLDERTTLHHEIDALAAIEAADAIETRHDWQPSGAAVVLARSDQPFELLYRGRTDGGKHCLAIEHECRVPTRDHAERLGKRHGLAVRTITAIIDEVRSSLAEWPLHAAELGVTASLQVVTESLYAIDHDFGINPKAVPKKL